MTQLRFYNVWEADSADKRDELIDVMRRDAVTFALLWMLLPPASANVDGVTVTVCGIAVALLTVTLKVVRSVPRLVTRMVRLAV